MCYTNNLAGPKAHNIIYVNTLNNGVQEILQMSKLKETSKDLDHRNIRSWTASSKRLRFTFANDQENHDGALG